MHNIYRVLLLIAYCGILIHCQGRGGGGGGGGGGSSGRRSQYFGGSETSCTTDECRHKNGIMAIVLTVVGICTAFGIIFCCKRCRGRPCRKNTTFINLPNSSHLAQEACDLNPFKSGIWSARYYQYERWHGPHQFLLSFNSQSMKVTGSGSDDIGTFTIDGIFSDETRRMGLTKTYQQGTGDQSENLGHLVTIQLTYYSDKHKFEGKWYVQTSAYHGEDKFELKFNHEQEFFAHKTV